MATTDEPAPHLRRRSTAAAVDGFVDTARRSTLRLREIIRGNGDATPYIMTKGVLVRPRAGAAAVLAASHIAVHVIEFHTRRSAVCSYHRVVRFDRGEIEGDPLVGLSCYMGSLPTAEKLASGEPFRPAELANFLLRVPAADDVEAVLATISARVRRVGVPATAHDVQPFV